MIRPEQETAKKHLQKFKELVEINLVNTLAGKNPEHKLEWCSSDRFEQSFAELEDDLADTVTPDRYLGYLIIDTPPNSIFKWVYDAGEEGEGLEKNILWNIRELEDIYGRLFLGSTVYFYNNKTEKIHDIKYFVELC